MSKKEKFVNPLNVNEIVEVSAVSYSHEGMGVCKYQNIPIFVNKMLVGEKGRVMIKTVKPNYAIGVLISLLTKSDARIKADCEHYNMCGGCSIRHMNDTEQNNFKSNLIKQNLAKYGRIDVAKVNVVTGEKKDYRNKASFVVSQEKGKIFLGFYKKNTHEVIKINSCLINDDLDDIKSFTENILNETKQVAFNQVTNQGNIKHVIYRKSSIGDIQITIVTKDGEIKNEERFIDKMTNRFPQIKSIVINHKFNNTNTILGKNQTIIYGDGFIHDEINGVKFRIGSQSFYQVNYEIMNLIYDFAIDNLNLTKDDNLLDAFCGIGTLSLLAAKKAASVTGIEWNDQAIDYANVNRKLNGFDNVKFFSGLVEEVVFKKDITFNKLIVDPARKGCDVKFLDFVGESNCEEISYISCNSSSLARDLKHLIENYGFKIEKIKGFDMFANTSHVETVVHLKREI